jgi:Asp-tRNA(Asn)/Glu-tRNA(Gln) amidotransferase C subunit
MEAIDRDLVLQLAALAGQPLPPGDVDHLVTRLAALAALLQPILQLDLTELPPLLDADPGWER